MWFVKLERALKWPLEIPFSRSNNEFILASFPKSGNTWFRFVVGNIISARTTGEQVDFKTIERYSPVIKKDRLIRKCIDSGDFPIFLKTHFYYVPPFKFYKAVVIYRNPEDVFRSFFYYVRSEHSLYLNSMSDLIHHHRLGLDAWRYFHLTWLRSTNCIFVSYGDLIERPEQGFTSIFDVLGCEITHKELQDALTRSSKGEMRRLELEYGDPNKKDSEYGFVGVEKNRAYSGDDLPMVRKKIKEELGQVLDKLETKKLKF